MSHRWKARVAGLLLATPGALVATWALFALTDLTIGLLVTHRDVRLLSGLGLRVAVALAVGLLAGGLGWALGTRRPRLAFGIYVFAVSGALAGALTALAVGSVFGLGGPHRGAPEANLSGLLVVFLVAPAAAGAFLIGGTTGLVLYLRRSGRGKPASLGEVGP